MSMNPGHILMAWRDRGMNRQTFQIGKDDMNAFEDSGVRVWIKIYDLVTKKYYLIRHASCGSAGCMCDAVYKNT